MRWTASVVGCGLLGLPLLLSAGQASAAPYWVAWEGNDYPENEGWERINFGVGPAVRTLENGILTIDSLWSDQISDFYRIGRLIDPEPGELFVAEWRVRVVENHGAGTADSVVVIAPDTPATLLISQKEDSLTSFFEGWTLAVAPGAFHTYRIHSSNMLDYELYVDGAFAFSGTWFVIGGNQSFVSWGDGVRGARSRTEWDYFRFGVVPEPATLGLSAMTLFVAILKRRHT